MYSWVMQQAMCCWLWLEKLHVGVQKQLGISSGAGSCARRPRWWHGNLFKAFYWACVGQPGTLDRKVAEAGQQLGDIQAQEFKTTGMGRVNPKYS